MMGEKVPFTSSAFLDTETNKELIMSLTSLAWG